MIWPLLVFSPALYYLLYWWWVPIEHFPVWYFISSNIAETYWTYEIAPWVVGFGLAILIVGFAQMVRARAQKRGLVTNGLYRLVRHPQHLGVAIMSFGMVMMNRYGLRIGDIIAWTLIVFTYLILADSEEAALQKEFGEAYSNYKRRVPFMIPFVPSFYCRLPAILPKEGWRRRLALAALYIIVLTLLIALLSTLPTFHTR